MAPLETHSTLASRLMAESDARAEALIGLARMFVSATLFLTVAAVLLQLPPEIQALRGHALHVALGVTASYFMLGVLSLLISRSRRYRPAWGLGFALFEVVLVLLNIYANINAPHANALFALASPLILMVAIVLVLQVLRYRLLIHTTVSVLLLSGTLALILVGGQTETVSDDFIAEIVGLYSLPPNMVRMVMFAVLATIVGVAIWRSRRLMERIATETEALHDRNRFLPRELTEALDDGDLERLRRGEERDAVILFVDMRDFTGLSERLGPAETAALLTHYRAAVTKTVTDHGGVVDKFIGDGVMCSFGLKCSLDEAAVQAVACAKAIVAGSGQKLGKDNPSYSIVCAMACGPVLVAAVGDENRLEFTVIGPPVNRAARVETFAKEKNLDVVITGEIFAMLGQHDQDWQDLGHHPLKGEATPTRLLALA
ncbi:MAG: adenylate/guanylate cyclase domain-containing protein [Pseudomonadota bacterium]